MNNEYAKVADALYSDWLNDVISWEDFCKKKSEAFMRYVGVDIPRISGEVQPDTF